MKEALKLALEALEFVNQTGDTQTFDMCYADKAITAIKEALAQPELCKYGQEPKSCTSNPMDCQCALDAALAQPEQEPVAWRAPNWGHSADDYVYRDFDDPVIGADGKPSPNNEPLYTTPQQRTWVGLTDEETETLIHRFDGDSHTLLDEVNARLKEKNT